MFLSAVSIIAIPSSGIMFRLFYVGSRIRQQPITLVFSSKRVRGQFNVLCQTLYSRVLADDPLEFAEPDFFIEQSLCSLFNASIFEARLHLIINYQVLIAFVIRFISPFSVAKRCHDRVRLRSRLKPSPADF